MPEQETESTAEAAAQQNEASPPGEATAQPEPEAAQVSREEFERLKAANQLVKEERDQLLDRLGPAAGGV